MEPDDLALACRLSGVPLGDLWLRYLEMGGSRSRSALDARLAGEIWPQREELYLSVAAEEALRDEGLPRVAPLAAVSVRLVDGFAEDDAVALRRTAAAVLEIRARGSRLSALFEQCARAREEARGARARAEAFRRSREATAQGARGGR